MKRSELWSDSSESWFKLGVWCGELPSCIRKWISFSNKGPDEMNALEKQLDVVFWAQTFANLYRLHMCRTLSGCCYGLGAHRKCGLNNWHLKKMTSCFIVSNITSRHSRQQPAHIIVGNHGVQRAALQLLHMKKKNIVVTLRVWNIIE